MKNKWIDRKIEFCIFILLKWQPIIKSILIAALIYFCWKLVTNKPNKYDRQRTNNERLYFYRASIL